MRKVGVVGLMKGRSSSCSFDEIEDMKDELGVS
jgi:hypothetical protein